MQYPERFTRLLLALGLLLTGSVMAFGQEVPRWEFGPSISLHKMEAGDSNSYYGIGGRGVLNFSGLFGAEVQFAHTSRSSTYAPDNVTTTECDDQFTVNLKTTWRPRSVRWINPFALSGMGMTRNSYRDVSVPPRPDDLTSHEDRFALRLGGGAEIIPHPRIAIRLELSDLMTHYPASNSSAPFCHCDYPAYWSNRPDASISLMVRIGAISKSAR